MTKPSPVALDHLELWVGNAMQARYLFTSGFGMGVSDAEIDSVDGDETVCLTSGGVILVVRQGRSAASTVARHVARHGDTVGDVVLSCSDPAALGDRARAYGLRVSDIADGVRIGLSPDGELNHSVGRDPLISGSSAGAGPHMKSVDHVAYCVPCGTALFYVEAYEKVFGLQRMDTSDYTEVGDEHTGMRTVVLRAGSGLTITLTEPLTVDGAGQTQRFLDAHGGPGVQHAAIAYDDLPATVKTLRSRGVEFLPIPPVYYDEVRGRLGCDLLPWDLLQRLEILVDADDHGFLLQLFTESITGRPTFFLELIERAGATGLGGNNVRALFAALHAAIVERPVVGRLGQG